MKLAKTFINVTKEQIGQEYHNVSKRKIFPVAFTTTPPVISRGSSSNSHIHVCGPLIRGGLYRGSKNGSGYSTSVINLNYGTHDYNERDVTVRRSPAEQQHGEMVTPS